MEEEGDDEEEDMDRVAEEEDGEGGEEEAKQDDVLGAEPEDMAKEQEGLMSELPSWRRGRSPALYGSLSGGRETQLSSTQGRRPALVPCRWTLEAGSMTACSPWPVWLWRPVLCCPVALAGRQAARQGDRGKLWHRHRLRLGQWQRLGRTAGKRV